jgi:transposase InsO family protein
MEVTRSGYYVYQHKNVCKKSKADMELIVKVKEIAKKTNNSYGSRRIAKSLTLSGLNVGRYKAKTLMKQADVRCKQRKRFKVTTQSNPKLSVAENKLNRQFQVSRPNCVWVSDITYLWTNEGWLYLAAILDLFSRKIVGWSIMPYLDKRLIHDALAMAISRRRPKSGLMHHSDRGCQYASYDYQRCLKELGITVSMSRKGNCWDNAVMERFFGSLKSERTDHKMYQTREEAKTDIVDYIEMFYNSERLHSTLGYISPMQFEKLNHFPAN